MKDTTTNQKINRIEPTKEKITGRGGLALFVRYMERISTSRRVEELFGSMRKSAKGLGIEKIFKQLFCFFVDGESFHLVRFDELAKDESYASTIESRQSDMASSHTIKRFFEAFSFVRIWLFRRLLQELFVWRLKVERPRLIIMNLDTTVLDNDDAKKREGVKPSYKGVKGFQPLQLSWGNHIVDAVFRSGDKHSNNGDTAAKTVSHVVEKIRKEYSEDVPIILRCDSGFFDDKNLSEFEKLGIGYVCSGKMLPDIRLFVNEIELTDFESLTNDELVNRALKEFGTEQLPFKRFESNAAFYYIMLLSFFLYECFKKDVSSDVTPALCYPSTFRRKLIDIGAKIVRTSGMIIMKVNTALFNRLNLRLLWTRCNSPPVFAFG